MRCACLSSISIFRLIVVQNFNSDKYRSAAAARKKREGCSKIWIVVLRIKWKFAQENSWVHNHVLSSYVMIFGR